MRHEVIDKYDDFRKLSESWNELVFCTCLDQVYMRHEWFDRWVRAHEIEQRLAVVTLWSDNQLVGVAPLYRKEFVFRGIQAKGLIFLSSPISPRCNFIVADLEYIPPLLERVFGLSDWDILFTENLEKDHEITKAYLGILGHSRDRFRSQIVDSQRSPYLLTEGTFDDYWNALTKKRQKFLERMCIKRLEKAKAFSFGKVETLEQWADFLPAMFAISEKSWKGLQETHLRQDGPDGQMYMSFTPVALQNGWVSIYTLSINDRIVGFEYLLNYHDRYALTRSDFDMDYKYYSPGNNIRLHILEDLYSQPRTCEYDLCGTDYAFKLEWCDRIRSHVTVTVGNRTWRGQAILFAKNVVLPGLQRITTRLRPDHSV